MVSMCVCIQENLKTLLGEPFTEFNIYFTSVRYYITNGTNRVNRVN